MSIYSLSNGNLTQRAFNSDDCRSKNNNTELAPGEWKVTIENTAGELWESNTVDVEFEISAVMSDVSIENDYETAASNGLDINSKTEKAILNVTFNKDYTGTLYVVNSKYEKGFSTTTADKGKNLYDFSKGKNDVADSTGSISKHLVKVNTLSSLTNKKATASAAAATTATYRTLGAYYEDASGQLHCKIVIDLAGTETVTRGDSYYLVWDQADLDGDEITVAGITRSDLNASEDAEVPYLEAPASIAVTSFSEGTTAPQITMYNEDGDVLEWWKDTTSPAKGIESVKVFGVSSNTKSSSDTPKNATAFTVDKGILKTTTPAIDAKYAYAKVVTDAGIFSEKAITLESELGESAIDALDKMSIAQSSSNPNDAEISFSGLSSKAPGKVYLFKEDKTASTGTATLPQFAALDLTDAIASADVEGGATKVTLSGVFSYKDMANAFDDAATGTILSGCKTDQFVAMYVPDDTQLWKSYSNGAYNAAGARGTFTLKPVITSIDKTDLTAKLETTVAGTDTTTSGSTTTPAAAGEIPVTVSGIQALDQFGNKWLKVGANSTDAKDVTNAASLSKINGVATSTEDYAVKALDGTAGAVSLAVNGEISFVVTLKTPAGAGLVIDKGDGVTVKVANLKNLEVKITAKDALGVPAATHIAVGAGGSAASQVAVGATLVAPAGVTTNGALKLSDAMSIS